ncbi:MAG TPA: ABC transporter permease, partial [Terriglobales bacterium]
MVQDLKFAFRRLRRSPGFAIAAILTLALAIGANAAVFNLVQSVLLAPLPYPHADRIVAVNTGFPDRTIGRFTFGDYNDIRSQATDFSSIAYYYGGEMGVQTGEHATFVPVMLTNADFAQVFSLHPRVGRFFSEAEAKTSAVVSERFAEQNFATAEAALGQSISLEGQAYNVVGVLPTGFDFPKGTEVWLGAENAPNQPNRDAFNIRGVVAELKPGVSLADAQAQVQTIGQRLQAAYPQTNKTRTFPLMSLQEQLVRKTRPALLLLEGAVVLVLLIACVNVAHLQLARATTRIRELAVRSAIGASRWQVARQIVAESLILATAGCVLGVIIADPIVRLLLRMAPPEMLPGTDVHMNLAVLAFAAAACVASTIFSGAAPVWQMWRTNLIDSLKQDSSRGMTGRSTSKLRSALVVGEVALTFVLAIAGGLLGRTLFRLTTTDPGFRGDHLLVAYAHAPATGRAALNEKTREFDRIYSDLAAIPGVERVAGVMGLPTGQYGSNGKYILPGQSERELDNLPDAIFSLSSPGYFSTLSIPLLRGRDFNASDQDG